jgi:uncharacterized protein YceH (UPF0502 family)
MEDRFEQLLDGGGEAASSSLAPTASEAESSVEKKDVSPDPPEVLAPAEDRLTRLEREVAELHSQLATLRADLGD